MHDLSRTLPVLFLMACNSDPGANGDDTSSPMTSADVQPGQASSGVAPPAGSATPGATQATVGDSTAGEAVPSNPTGAPSATADAEMTATPPTDGAPAATTTGPGEPAAADDQSSTPDDATSPDDAGLGETLTDDATVDDSSLDGAAGEPAVSDDGEPPASGASPGCSAPTLTPGDQTVTVDVGGTMRSFILHIPSSYTGDSPTPFIIDFHPLGGSGSQEQQGSGYQSIADQEGFPIAFPNGIDNAWNVGPCCTNSRDVDDVAFAVAIVDYVATSACIDQKRVYSVGFSMGGGMSHYLACNAADTFAAVAPAAFDLLIPEEQPCDPARPISSLTFRGTQDTTSPFEGGPGPSGRATFRGAYGGFEAWRELNGCNDVNTVDGDCTIYTECDAGVEVGLCVAQGGGHAYGDADLAWSFLQRFTLP